jgi:hypothetical protein
MGIKAYGHDAQKRCRRFLSCQGFGGVPHNKNPPKSPFTKGGLRGIWTTGGSVIVSPFQGGQQGVDSFIMQQQRITFTSGSLKLEGALYLIFLTGSIISIRVLPSYLHQNNPIGY